MNRKAITIALSLLLVLSIYSCSTSKNTSTIQDAGKFKLIVSFFSPGNGIDRIAKTAYLSFLKENYPQVAYEQVLWGKEGETDLCFTLEKLGSKEQNKFITESKKTLTTSKRVRFYENTDYKHQPKE